MNPVATEPVVFRRRLSAARVFLGIPAATALAALFLDFHGRPLWDWTANLVLLVEDAASGRAGLSRSAWSLVITTPASLLLLWIIPWLAGVMAGNTSLRWLIRVLAIAVFSVFIRDATTGPALVWQNNGGLAESPHAAMPAAASMLIPASALALLGLFLLPARKAGQGRAFKL